MGELICSEEMAGFRDCALKIMHFVLPRREKNPIAQLPGFPFSSTKFIHFKAKPRIDNHFEADSTKWQDLAAKRKYGI